MTAPYWTPPTPLVGVVEKLEHELWFFTALNRTFCFEKVGMPTDEITWEIPRLTFRGQILPLVEELEAKEGVLPSYDFVAPLFTQVYRECNETLERINPHLKPWSKAQSVDFESLLDRLEVLCLIER